MVGFDPQLESINPVQPDVDPWLILDPDRRLESAIRSLNTIKHTGYSNTFGTRTHLVLERVLVTSQSVRNQCIVDS